MIGFSAVPTAVIAQTNYPACLPPNPNEYLLLVISKAEAEQAQVKQVLPSSSNPTICNYLDHVVTRVGGFTSIETANALAESIRERLGLSAFVAQTATTPPPRNVPAYNPQPLGTGYAVLVDYQNQPEVATQVRQLLKQDIGLVSYGQRPYLLAIQTPDQRAASSTFQSLSDRGFWAMLVDSDRVILLRSAIK
jgi:hypothetical protein